MIELLLQALDLHVQRVDFVARMKLPFLQFLLEFEEFLTVLFLMQNQIVVRLLGAKMIVLFVTKIA